MSGGARRETLGPLYRAWALLPESLRAPLYPQLRGLYAHLQRVDALAAGHTLHSIRLSGPTVAPAAPTAELVLFGAAAELEDAGQRWFASAPTPTPRPDCGLPSIGRQAGRALADAALVVVFLPRLARGLLPERFLVLPESVEVVIPVQPARAAIAARREPLRRYLGLIEREGLRLEIRRDADSLGRFYAAHYRPYQRRRFGPAAPERGQRFYRRFAGRWEVLAILAGDRWLGAGTGIRHEDRYRFLDVGYLDGDEGLLKRGVGHALYRAAIERAAELGYAELDLGPERPFLADSVLSYKRKWGARLRSNPWASRSMAIAWRRSSSIARTWLAAVPLIFEDRDGALHRLLPPGEPANAAVNEEDAALGLAGSIDAAAARRLGAGSVR